MGDGGDALRKGREIMKKVYPDLSVPPGAEEVPFHKLMLKNLFADVWGSEALSIRDKRLIIIGVIAAEGDPGLIDIQLRSALANGELKREQLRDIPLMLTQYVGYPRAVPVMLSVERILKETEEAGA